MYASLATNGLMVFALLNNYLYFSFNIFSYTAKLSEYYIGILGALYQHILFIPFLFFSIDSVDSNAGASLPNIICTILLGKSLYEHTNLS